jgi:hypothetical protein
MRRAKIEEENRYLLERQRQFRMAADLVTSAFAAFSEVQAIAVIGSVGAESADCCAKFRGRHVYSVASP